MKKRKIKKSECCGGRMLDGDQCEVCGSDGINHGAGSNCPVDNCPKCEESDNQFSN